MNRDDLEAVIWHALRGLRSPTGAPARSVIVDEILTAADAYAAGDSDGLTAIRRDVLRHAAAPGGGT